MCDKFFESVGVSEDALFSSPLNVIHQVGEKIEGAFLSHFMLTQFFRKFSNDNAKALIISTHHTKAHWINIASKLGTNLTALQEKGAVTVIDLLKEVYDNLKTKSESSEDSAPERSCPLCLKNLYNRCESLVKDFRKNCGSKRILVIVEDVTVFLQNAKVNTNNFQISERDVLELIVKLKSLSITSREEDQSCMSVVSLVQSPETPSEFPEMFRFAKSVSHALPSIMFEVSPLSTGFSSQVSGYLKVFFKLKSISSKNGTKGEEAPFIKNYHFKLESNSVRVIPL